MAPRLSDHKNRSLKDYFRLAVQALGSLYFQSLFLSCTLLIAVLYLAISNRLIGRPDVRITASSVDLSGPWKIQFKDDSTFKDPSTEDSAWCWINVPDATIPVPADLRAKASPDCPKESYPKKRMVNSTFWYRKWVEIPADANWASPSLFIGYIKREGWVYWDGTLVGGGPSGSVPFFLYLAPEQVTPGRHLLSVKVRSADDPYPGIFHGHPRKVAIGALDDTRKAVAHAIQVAWVEPAAVLVFQVSALLLLIFFVIRAGEVNESLIWLSLYFGASGAYACVGGLRGSLLWFVSRSALIGMSLGLVGYGGTVLYTSPSERYFYRTVILFSGLLSIALQTAAFLHSDPSWLSAQYYDKIVIFGSLAFLIFSVTRFFLSQKSAAEKLQIRDQRANHLTFATLFILHFYHVLTGVILADIPNLLDTPIVNPILTLIVIAFAIEDHVNKEKHLAFFGRYVRRGLKELLLKNERRAIAGEKIVAGRRIPIMRIDIVGHTDATYGLPYGIKRLFQDAWFSAVDEVVADKTFLDKGLGDGSFYYFQEDTEGKTCTQVMDAANRILNEVVQKFDEDFSIRKDQLLTENPALRKPFQQFLERYRAKTGQDFLKRKTAVRFVLVFGHIDEGLWGLPSQGHYDVHGDLVTLAARLEKYASAGEILFNREFIEQLRAEGAILKDDALEWRIANLKGIGPHEFAIFKGRWLTASCKAA